MTWLGIIYNEYSMGLISMQSEREGDRERERELKFCLEIEKFSQV